MQLPLTQPIALLIGIFIEFADAANGPTVMAQFVIIAMGVDMIDKWYAIRLTNEAAKPDRFRWVEIGKRDGRYLRSLDLEKSVIQSSMDAIDVELYIPMKKRTIVHPRTKKRIERYRPMFEGFGFVRGVVSFHKLDDANGVIGVLRDAEGRPLEIPPADMDDVRFAEVFTNKQTAVGRTVHVKSGYCMGQDVRIDAVTSRRTIKTMAVFLGGLTKVEINVDDLDDVNYLAA